MRAPNYGDDMAEYQAMIAERAPYVNGATHETGTPEEADR